MEKEIGSSEIHSSEMHFPENDSSSLSFPYICGVSAGACSALGYVSRQPERMKKCMIHENKKDSYFRVGNILRLKSLLDMDTLFDRYPNELIPFDYDTYFSSKVKCEIVVTNCITGKAEYLTENSDRKRLMDLCRASSSLPLMASMVYIDGVPYMDGGLSDSIPVVHALNKGYKKLVIVLTRNKGYKKETSLSQFRACLVQYRRYPELIKAIYHRADVYNRTVDLIERLERAGRVFVIRPQTGLIGRMEQDYRKLTDFYLHGYDLMREKEAELKDFLR
jgi:predicted patatin/cPLA2 family phospholipase